MAKHRGHEPPHFLSLAPAAPKPRSARLTRVLDNGLSPGDLRILLARFAAHVDIWKLGWGTAYLDPDLREKLSILDRHGVWPCLGGTLLEAAWLQGRFLALEALRRGLRGGTIGLLTRSPPGEAGRQERERREGVGHR